ncbi:hypothetical protein FHX74_002784 [Friedmanniella endophytica]|uniref:LarA-like N-terminal domain-containing protein n=1 Tax=Microlunatus kandeliicorticis TaxID=1759536 RepID=A0A7W3ITW6_9ACTN|nr:lactate racemase domain-containing protein [Microlunatus kandeliicorticis]MBA8795156.1 hypothetical protein [Microlunatus kandeliicorticis]
MARPGFVLEVDERTPPLLVHDGPRLRTEQFPLGTEVVYPPDPATPVDDLTEAIDAACAHPVGSDPLADRLRPGMRLTLVFDDLSSPGVRLRSPDVRGRVVERVLTLAAAAGVDDVVLVGARGLERRSTDTELRRVLGERVFRSFHGDGRLLQHDAEDRDGLTVLDPGGDGAPEVAIHRRVAESDLVVLVHLVTRPGAGGLELIARGLGSPATATAPRAVELIGAAVPVFALDAVVSVQRYGGRLEFLGRREWEWGLAAQGAYQAVSRGLSAAPSRWADRLAGGREASATVSLVTAGDPTAVAAASAAHVAEHLRVQVDGQADVLVVGAPDPTPYSIDSLTNPVLALWNALVPGVGATTGTPLVREGGAVVLYHPLSTQFSALHHPSYVDFFSSVLPVTADPARLAEDFESKFAEDPWWRNLYRTAHAFHGVHPFHRWYELAPVLAHCGDVVAVGADRAAASRLGLRAASTLADALEIVAAGVGHSPRIRYLRNAAPVSADVR